MAEKPKPMQILSIEKPSGSKLSKFVLEVKLLHKLLSDVYDKEVVVISIAGPSRRGKSFVLSYYLRYLSDPLNVNWIGDNDLPLTGFKWRSGTKPETKGIWMWSKPFVIRQSTGKELAVILLDSQGVYDQYTDNRDWATIVGLNMLTASDFILNIFTSIQEDIFNGLESFLNYAQMAANSDANNKAFQKLIFLIRDWNSPLECSYGQKGGEKFLKQELTVKDNQSEAAQRVRQLIGDCFKEMRCYLMPEPGWRSKEDETFNGSVGQLEKKFVDKLKEFFSTLLNPEAMRPKVINGKAITGRDLCRYLEAYVERFNSEELPRPIDLMEATAKVADMIEIHNIKQKYKNHMKEYLQSKPFHSRVELNNYNILFTEDTKREFERNMRSKQNSALSREIQKILGKELFDVYQALYQLNDQNRERTASEAVDECCELYRKQMFEFIANKTVEPKVFDEMSENSRNAAERHFNNVCGTDDSNLLAPYLNKIVKHILEVEKNYRFNNYKLIDDGKRANKEAVRETLDFYNKQMKTKLNDSIFLPKNLFDDIEMRVRTEAMNIFANRCTFGDSVYIKKFENKAILLLKEAKTEIELLNNSKHDIAVTETEKVFAIVLKAYVDEVTQCMKGYSCEDELNDCHEKSKALALSRFEEKCPVVDNDFMGPYFNRLKADIDKAYAEIVVKFNDSMKKFHDFYKNTTYMLVNSSYSNLERLFGADPRSQEERDSLKESIIEDVRQRFEKSAKVFEDIEAYIEMKTDKAFDLKIIAKLKDLYATKMEAFIKSKAYFSRRSLNIQHNQIKDEIFTTICENAKSTDEAVLKNFAEEINQHMERVYNSLYEQNERKREITVEESINKTLTIYEQSVDIELRENFLRENDFTRLSDQIKRNLMQEFDDICGEENELFNSYRQKVLNKLRDKENEYKSLNKRVFIEANDENTAAVNNWYAFYKNNMSVMLADIDLCVNHTFEELEKPINVEAMSRFENECVAGDELFVSQFADDLRTKIQTHKSESEVIFKTSVRRIQSETRNEMSIALTTYTHNMRDFLDLVKSKAQFDDKHRTQKERAIDSFRQRCRIKEGQYISEQIHELKSEIDNSFVELIDRFVTQVKRSDDFINELISRSVQEYSNSEIFKGDVVLSDDELEDLNQSIAGDSKQLFHAKLLSEIGETDDIDKHLNKFEREIKSVFDRFKRDNYNRRLQNTTTLENAVKKFAALYEEQIEKVSEFCDNDKELMVNHANIEEAIKRDFMALNVYNNDQTFETYVTKLEVEINKTLNDVNKIFSLRMDNQSLKNKNLLIEAKRYYKEEMKKYYQRTNYIKPENLQRCHKSATNITIERFLNQREFISVDKFKNLIRDSLTDSYETIERENNMNVPTTPAIGIDLGTTNSCVAYYQTGRPNGRIVIIDNELGVKTTASVVEFKENGDVVVGNVAKKEAHANPHNTIFSAKRLIGRKFTDNEVQRDMELWPFRVVGDEYGFPKLSVKINNDDKLFSAEEISAKVLKNLKQNAERHLGFEVKKAVITVPAYFNDAQKEATKDAGKIAGLDVLAIINEPTAAAIAYRMDRDDSEVKKVLIFDFGGGTFDVAILDINCGNIEIKAVNGDNHLGGDDIDTNVVKYCLQMFSETNGIEVPKNTRDGEKCIRRLTTLCEEKKWHLSTADNVWIRLDQFYGGHDLAVEMSREKFDDLNDELFVRAMDVVEQALADAQLNHTDINDVVMVGGSTRIRKIREMLSDMFFGKELNYSVDADLAVAVGAAYHAAVLNGNQAAGMNHVKVCDVSPMDLGIRVRDGSMSVIVPRNSPVPNKYTKEYETTGDNQREISIEVYEGEKEIATDNRKLGTFTMSGIPPMPAGEQKVDVSFEINDEGILHVSARLLSTDIESAIEIQEHKGRLSDADLIALIEQEANQR